jgi:hypothetical protein
LYSIDNGNRTQIPLKLINGFPFNGTYFGQIWLKQENKNVKYNVSFTDELNYKLNCEHTVFVESPVDYHMLREIEEKNIYNNENKVINPPTIKNVSIVGATLPNKPVKVRAFVHGSDVPINNVTLFYSTLAYYDQNYTFNYTKMMRNTTYDDLYEGKIPAFPERTNVSWYIAAFDKENNKRSEGLHINNQFGDEDD